MEYTVEIRAAQEKRAKAHAAMKQLVDLSLNEKRSMSGEETQQYEALKRDYQASQEEIRCLEEVQTQEKFLSEVPAPQGGSDLGKRSFNEGDTRSLGNETEEYRSAFFDYARQGNRFVDTRALVAGTGAKGGFLVPKGFEANLLKALQETNVMRQICEVRSLGYGESSIPVVEDYGVASWLDEGEEYGETDDTFSQVSLKAKKMGRIQKISEELLADNAFNLEAELIYGYGISFGRAEEAAFINGNSTRTATGILVDTSKTVTTVAPNAITYDDIVKLKFAVTAPYRKRAVWLLSDEAALVISMLKDGMGRPIWQPSLQEGTPDMLLGRPVYYSPEMPTMGTGNTPVLFGDTMKYRIADRSGMFIQRLDELYAKTGHIGFRGRRRLDGKLLDTKATAKLILQ